MRYTTSFVVFSLYTTGCSSTRLTSVGNPARTLADSGLGLFGKGRLRCCEKGPTEAIGTARS